MREVVKRRSFTAGLALLLGLAAALWLQPLIPSGSLTTPDSLHYLHAARSLRVGQGLTMVDGSLWSDKAYRPFTTWPPLYPVVLSLAVSGHERPEVGAGHLATILFALTVALFFLAARRLGRPLIAVAATLLFAVNSAVLTVYAYTWSEQLFLPLALAAWLALDAALRRSPRCPLRRGWWAWWPHLAAGVALAVATYTRYIGLALFPVLLVPLAASRSSSRDGRHPAPVRPVAASLLLAAAVIAPLLIRNLVLTGHWGGAPRTAPTRSVAANLADLTGALRFQLLPPETPASALGLTGLAVVAIALFWWRGRRAQRRSAPADRDGPVDPVDRASSSWLPWAFALVYFGALVALRSAASFDRIDTRLATPGMAFVVLGVAAVCETVVGRVAHAGAARVMASAAAAVLLLAPAAGQAAIDLRLVRAVRGGEPEPCRMTATERYINFARFRPENVPTAVRREAARCRQAGAFLVTDANPFLLHHLLDVKAKALPDTLDDPAVLARINTVARGGSLVILDARKAARLRAVAGDGWDAVATTHREGQGSVTVLHPPLPVPGG
jgi:hypothetical protein